MKRILSDDKSLLAYEYKSHVIVVHRIRRVQLLKTLFSKKTILYGSTSIHEYTERIWATFRVNLKSIRQFYIESTSKIIVIFFLYIHNVCVQCIWIMPFLFINRHCCRASTTICHMTFFLQLLTSISTINTWTFSSVTRLENSNWVADLWMSEFIRSRCSDL